MRSRIAATLGACGIILCACASGNRVGSVSRPSSADGLEPVVVEVSNHHLSEVSVVLLRGAERRRLGYVRPQSSASFVVPGRFVLTGRDVRLLVEPNDMSRGAATEPIVARPRQRVSLHVEPDVRLSNIHVW